jgi:hypothetical protein
MGWDFLPVSALRGVVDLAVRLVELGGAAVILAGATWAFAQFVVSGVVRMRGAKASQRPLTGSTGSG